MSTDSLGSILRLHSACELLRKKNKGIDELRKDFMQLY